MTDNGGNYQHKGRSLHFISPVDESLICSLCKGILTEPVCAPCGHSFCKRCLREWRKTSPNCLHCSTPLGPGPHPVVLPFNVMIRSLLVECPSETAEDGTRCTDVVSLGNLDDHFAVCPMVLTPCRYCRKAVQRAKLAAHDAKHHIKCPHAKRGCGFVGDDAAIASHADTCPVAACISYITELEGALNETAPDRLLVAQVNAAQYALKAAGMTG